MDELCDVVVIGGGGAGLTAALYTSRASLSTVLFEKHVPGGQIAITDIVENYPGFPEGITGPDIAASMETQAKKYGAQIRFDEVTAVRPCDDHFVVTTGAGDCSAKAVIVATGAQARMVGVPGETELIGKGVSYCATCDAPFFRNKTVAVVGGGDSAIQEGLFLTKFAREVIIIHRRDALRASAVLQKRALAHPKMKVMWHSVVERINGTTLVESITVRNVKTGETQPVPLQGVFVFIGHAPSSALFKGLVTMDDHGYIITDDTFQTSLPGLFACGEVRHGALWQLVAACGEGCRAGLSAQHYIEQRDGV